MLKYMSRIDFFPFYLKFFIFLYKILKILFEFSTSTIDDAKILLIYLEILLLYYDKDLFVLIFVRNNQLVNY